MPRRWPARTARTRSSRSTRRPASSARRCSRTGSPSARCAPGSGRGSGPSRRSPSSSPRTARTRSTGSPRGEDAAAALAACSAPDALAAVRQVGVVDARGRVAVHTGADCIPEAGHAIGEHWACQANMMARATVPDAMSAAFAAAGGDLAERLMTALEGAEAEGGDVRGRQSAALVVAPAQGEPWQVRAGPARRGPRRPGRRAAPPALAPARLRAGGRRRRARGRGARGRGGGAVRARLELAPQSDELLFWAGLAIAQQGDVAPGPTRSTAPRRSIPAGSRCSSGSRRSSPRQAPR